MIEARVESFEDELEECYQVLGVGRRDVDVHVAECNRTRYGEAEARGLASTSGRREAVWRPERGLTSIMMKLIKL